MIEQIFSQATGGLTSGIQIDVMAVISAMINIGLLLLGCRIIYGIIKGETLEGYIQGIKDRQDESDYQEIYAEEKEKYRIAKMRARARDEIRGL